MQTTDKHILAVTFILVLHSRYSCFIGPSLVLAEPAKINRYPSLRTITVNKHSTDTDANGAQMSNAAAGPWLTSIAATSFLGVQGAEFLRKLPGVRGSICTFQAK